MLILAPDNTASMPTVEGWDGKERTAAVMRSGGILLTGRMLNAGALVAANAVLARLLSVHELGLFFAAFAFALVASVLAAGGVGDFLVREVARSAATEPAVVPGILKGGMRALAVSLGLTAVGALAFCLVVPNLLGLHALSPEDATGLLLMLVAFAGRLVVAGAWRGLGTAWPAAIADGAAGNLAFLAVTLILWFRGTSLGHVPVAILYALVNLVFVLLVAMRLPWRVIWRSATPRVSIDTVLRMSAPMMLQALTGVMTVQITIFALASIAQPREIAFAGLALQAGNAMALLSVAVHLALAPELARLHGKGDRVQMAKLCRLLSLAASVPILPVVLCLWIAGETVCEFVFGVAYREAAFPLAVFCTARFLMAAMGPAPTVLMMTGHATIGAVVQTIGVTISALLVTLVYPHYGFDAAVIAAALPNVLQVLVLVIETRRRLGFWTLPLPAKLGSVAAPR